MDITLLEALKKRRSVYSIGKNSTVRDEDIMELLKQAVLHAPSAFNCQSGRAVVLFGAAHLKLWDITKETLRKRVPADKFRATETKIGSFAAGHGTVLFFNDTSVTESLMEKFPAYRDNFQNWAQQAGGMLQYAVWMLLEQEGLGASLQHYNPLIDAEVSRTWKLPDSWQLLAEMPFGIITARPGEKEYQPLEHRLLSFNK